MAPKRTVEALQFELAFGEAATEDPGVVPSASAPPGPATLKARAIQEARDALADGYLPEPAHDTEAVTHPAGETSDSALSVGAFYERLRSVVREGFPDEVWVTGEIRKVSVSKGHHYLELADRGAEAEPVSLGRRATAAALEVACWSRDWPYVAARLDSVGLELSAGMVVRVRGRVSIWEAGGRLRFSMSDIDVEALVGGIAAARRRLLATLEAEGVIDANRRLPVPLVPLRIGLVTSPGSEAYRDFTGQLQRSGLEFKVTLEASQVQGAEAPFHLQQALERLQGRDLDLIVLVRGGGAKGDLAAFDHEVVARAIVASRYPVWTGIGHTGDRSVADELAQRALVTPTACGEAVVDAVCSFLDQLGTRAARMLRAAARAMDAAEHAASSRRSDLTRAARHELSRADSELVSARVRTERAAALAVSACATVLSRRSDRLAGIATSRLAEGLRRNEHAKALLRGFDPRRQLERGWSLTRAPGGKIVRSVKELAPGEQVVTTLADGTVRSEVVSIEEEGE